MSDKYRVWWASELHNDVFRLDVASISQAMNILVTLAMYNNHLGNNTHYSGGLETFLNDEWVEWYSESGKDINQLLGAMVIINGLVTTK